MNNKILMNKAIFILFVLMLAGVARTEWTVEGAYDTVVVKAKSAWDSVAHLGEHKELNKLQKV